MLFGVQSFVQVFKLYFWQKPIIRPYFRRKCMRKFVDNMISNSLVQSKWGYG